MRIIKTTYFHLLIFFFIFLAGCKKTSKEIFFSNLIGAKIDMKIASDRYFIKSFGIAAEPLTIMNNSYWRLQDDERSYFYLEGYLRNDIDSIMILPSNFGPQVESLKVYKLFDFSLKYPKSWKLLFKIGSKTCKGDSVAFLNKTVMKKDTLYNYSLTPFILHSSINDYDYNNQVTFNIAVSKKNGIINIIRCDHISRSVIYEATIYPNRKFINNVNHLLEL